MQRNVFLSLVVFCCLSAAAYANPSITAGNWTINPAAGQNMDAKLGVPIRVLTSGGELDAFAGVDLATHIDGGVMMSLVDIIGAGTLFAPNNTGVTEFFPGLSADKYTLTTTTAGTVGPTGTLAFVTFDATGVAPGTYAFNLTNFVGASDLPPFSAPILINGTVRVLPIPEPGSIVLAVFAAGALCAVAIRRRRKMA